MLYRRLDLNSQSNKSSLKRLDLTEIWVQWLSLEVILAPVIDRLTRGTKLWKLTKFWSQMTDHKPLTKLKMFTNSTKTVEIKYRQLIWLRIRIAKGRWLKFPSARRHPSLVWLWLTWENILTERASNLLWEFQVRRDPQVKFKVRKWQWMKSKVSRWHPRKTKAKRLRHSKIRHQKSSEYANKKGWNHNTMKLLRRLEVLFLTKM